MEIALNFSVGYKSQSSIVRNLHIQLEDASGMTDVRQ